MWSKQHPLYETFRKQQQRRTQETKKKPKQNFFLKLKKKNKKNLQMWKVKNSRVKKKFIAKNRKNYWLKATLKKNNQKKTFD